MAVDLYGAALQTDVQPLTPQESAERFGPFLAKTDTVERPSPTDPVYRYHGPDEMARAQRQWDAAKESADRVAAWSAGERAKREATATKAREEREAAELEKRTNARIDLEAKLKREFMANPAATEHDWEAIKDQRIRDHLLAQSTANDQAARRSQAAIYTG